MHLVLSALWLGIAMAWLSGIMFIARLIGGYQWIQHTGQAPTVAMLGLMAGLCVASAITLAVTRRLPKFLMVAVAVVAGLHLFNAVGLYILFSTNGHVSGAVMLPFSLVSSVLPTTTSFVGIPPGNVSLFILPVATIVAWVASLVSNPSVATSGRGA